MQMPATNNRQLVTNRCQHNIMTNCSTWRLSIAKSVGRSTDLLPRDGKLRASTATAPCRARAAHMPQVPPFNRATRMTRRRASMGEGLSEKNRALGDQSAQCQRQHSAPKDGTKEPSSKQKARNLKTKSQINNQTTCISNRHASVDLIKGGC